MLKVQPANAGSDHEPIFVRFGRLRRSGAGMCKHRAPYYPAMQVQT